MVIEASKASLMSNFKLCMRKQLTASKAMAQATGQLLLGMPDLLATALSESSICLQL